MTHSGIHVYSAYQNNFFMEWLWALNSDTLQTANRVWECDILPNTLNHLMFHNTYQLAIFLEGDNR